MWGRGSGGCRLCFRERTSYFSLEYQEIQPSAAFGTRERNALREEGFAWVPDLGSFFKLLGVGFSPYFGFIPSLSVFQCFGWIEAIRGRLIGPKPWDRINIKFGNKMEQPVAAPRLIWVQKLCIVC